MINKLPSIEDCWSVDKFIVNTAIRNFMARTRFQVIIENILCANNEVQDTNDEAANTCQLLDLFTWIFSEILENSKNQSLDVHTCELKAKPISKQYIKKK